MTHSTENAHGAPTSGAVLARGVLWNLVGMAAPIAVAFFAIPPVLRSLGTDRFGVLSLTWMVVGYFTFLDLGLGRALTKLVAEQLGRNSPDDLPGLIWTALLMMGCLGVVGALVLGVLSPWLVERVFKIPVSIRRETLQTFYLLSASIPWVVTTTGLRGILEAWQRFDLTNAVRIPLGIYTFVCPLFVLPFSRSLFWVTLLLVAGRVAAWFVQLLLCLKVVPGLGKGVRPRFTMIGRLLRFGGWMTVSNVISPLLIYLDRLLIGALVSVAAVAYYSTPWEVVTKLLLVPGAIAGVLFPTFSHSGDQEPGRVARVYRRGLKYIYFTLFPATLGVFVFAREGLHFWLGVEFAESAFRATQFLAVGVLMNGVAAIPFAFLQGTGRPELTARLHFLEMVAYVPCAWWLVSRFGIEGAAAAWLVRVGMDALLLMVFANRVLTPAVRLHRQIPAILLTAAAFTLGIIPLALASKAAVFGCTILCLVLLYRYRFLADDERSYLNGMVGARFRQNPVR